MTVCRTHKSKSYFKMSNSTAQNQMLSFEALGILTYCLSMPEKWEFHPKLLWKQRDCGRDAIYKRFNEIIANYHCIRIRLPNPKIPNLPGEIEYEFFDDIEDCKSRIKELESSDLFFEHADNLKKYFRRPAPQDPGIQDTIKDEVLYKPQPNSLNLEKEQISDEKIVAPTPKKSKKKKIKQPTVIRIDNEIPELRIETSDEHHANLLEKFGQVFTQQCYQSLARWKKSKYDAGEKIAEHTDYYRILEWVAEKEKKNQSNPLRVNHKDKILEKFKHGGIYNGAECYINDEGIAFQRGITHLSAKFKDGGFKEQLANILRKFEIS